MTKTKSTMQVAVECGWVSAHHDVYITYNNHQWLGFTCRTLEDLRKVHDEIGSYLERHSHEH